jgi:hypothetical protein
MRARNIKYLPLALVAFLFVVPLPAAANAGVKSTFQYSLSNLYGKFPFNEVRVRADRIRDEVYVVDRGTVRIFNNVGMEVYWFGDDPSLGVIYDLAVDEKGDIFLLSYDLSNALAPKYSIIRCNFRGEIKEILQVSGLPSGFSPFGPNTMVYRDGSFFLVNMNEARAIRTDKKGVFQRGYDFLKIIELPEKDRSDKELFGFSIDPAGNLLFTIPVLFKAYVVSPEGKMVASFGKAGSAPGMFGVVSGIAMDDLGNYIVVERLRSVVMVFDKEFRFLQEFGYRGTKPANLIQPNDLVVGNTGKLYVTQVRERGVSVFTLVSD